MFLHLRLAGSDRRPSPPTMIYSRVVILSGITPSPCTRPRCLCPEKMWSPRLLLYNKQPLMLLLTPTLRAPPLLLLPRDLVRPHPMSFFSSAPSPPAKTGPLLFFLRRGLRRPPRRTCNNPRLGITRRRRRDTALALSQWHPRPTASRCRRVTAPPSPGQRGSGASNGRRRQATAAASSRSRRFLGHHHPRPQR